MRRLSIMSYNVLAQCYVRSSFFPYCDSKALRWKNRSQLLKNQFAALPTRPDVICLQECDQYEAFWKDTMAAMGYAGMYAQKTSAKQDGVAIFWQPDRLELLHSEQVHLKHAAVNATDADLARRLLARDNVGLLGQFRSTVDGALVVVATTHLFWDPKEADVKLAQTEHMLSAIASFTATRAGSVFLAGDFNSLPDSDVYKLITATYGSAYAAYAADGEPAFTNCNGVTADGSPAFLGTLDYIFYERPRVDVAALAPLMTLADATCEGALPNRHVGSDHLPLLAEFVFKE
ncbi:hypothetical protein SPRG_12545 [Saprolegnia parasitica CBS 223.65]|uniref:Endonuclease/exonuclease/phosphatase domain-containing protein n=1 Tax=Saprolegnia parasitica (strain CBS 223.65) TaxID=695850 RepID=A0A067C0C4_SAPPC|nr:hypothetical protein SPRG_12545 [Saprolegnia parasitica CBS 223.65]KDO22565.1 hypothetical protein SPRG_12545 [Saprolegnia parasitica CBS 223.65]|eukprot:XP_012206681.1 hypothetical protein SPRG_12545 [Saprolegnia parasitica CBS 223.65]